MTNLYLFIKTKLMREFKIDVQCHILVTYFLCLLDETKHETIKSKQMMKRQEKKNDTSKVTLT